MSPLEVVVVDHRPAATSLRDEAGGDIAGTGYDGGLHQSEAKRGEVSPNAGSESYLEGAPTRESGGAWFGVEEADHLVRDLPHAGFERFRANTHEHMPHILNHEQLSLITD